MSLARLLFLATICLPIFGCAQIPPQSVELSVTLGRDLQELHRSHRKAIDLLHDRDIERINRYVEQVVIPTYTKTVIDGLGLRLSQDISKATEANATQADKDRIYEEMRKIVLGISSRVEKERQELASPIEDARKARLQELDMAYAQIQKANSVVTAHLASILKITTVQDDLLTNAGLKDFRQLVGESALSKDKQIEDALTSAKDVEDAIGKLKQIFEQINK